MREATPAPGRPDHRSRRRSRPLAPGEGPSPEPSGRRPFMYGHLSRSRSQIYFVSPVGAPLAGPWSVTCLFFGGLPPTRRR